MILGAADLDCLMEKVLRKIKVNLEQANRENKLLDYLRVIKCDDLYN